MSALSVMIRTACGAVLIAFAFGRADGQAPPGRLSVYLTSAKFQMVMTPDVEGLYLWASFGDVANGREHSFGALFDPAQTLTWIASARAFLDNPLGENDTGSVRISAVLWGSEGGRAYLAKRRDKKRWSSQRIFVIQSDSARIPPVVAAIDEKTIRQVLDSLEEVSSHAPAPQHPAVRDSAGEGLLFDHMASLKPGTVPPSYPESERSERKEGMVLVRFIIGVDGRVDLPTISVLHASSSGFLEATLVALTRFRFKPATFRGKPAREQIVMPFVFANR